MDELDKIRRDFEEKKEQNIQFGQSVPESYFDDLESNILKAVAQGNLAGTTSTKPKVKLYMLLRYSAAVAAILLVFFGISQFDKSSLANTEFTELSEMESVDYLMTSNEFYTEDLLEIDGIDEVLSELEEQLKKD